MYKYDGLVIHQSHDDDGILEVVEQQGVRSLHFGSYPKQSSLLLSDPDQLYLDYARAMTSWLLFKENPNNALLVGLGGGSLAKHLLHHFPECRLRAVEYRKSVVKIARSHFGLPLDPHLKIIVADGGQYLRQHSESHGGHYDLVLIDAFDHEGLAQAICSVAFFDACKVVLKNDGIMAINLWGTDKALFEQIAQWLGQIFNWKILFLPVRDKGNIIGLAFNDDTPLYSMQDLRERAAALEQHYQIEFPAFLKDLKKHNSRLLSKVIKP
jgi:spermidine synthase